MKQNFRKNFKKCQLPIITINVLGIKMNFLVDSGSSKNQISGAAFKIMKETDLYKENFADYQGKNKVSGVGGEAIIQPQVLLGYYLDRRKYADVFGILPDTVFKCFEEESGLVVSGILGSSFFVSHNIVIDYETMTVYTKA